MKTSGGPDLQLPVFSPEPPHTTSSPLSYSTSTGFRSGKEYRSNSSIVTPSCYRRYSSSLFPTLLSFLDLQSPNIWTPAHSSNQASKVTCFGLLFPPNFPHPFSPLFYDIANSSVLLLFGLFCSLYCFVFLCTVS